MTTITDNFTQQRIREAISRADWKWEKLQVGVYVFFRGPPYPVGRIIDRIVKNADDEAVKLLRSPYVVYRVRYFNGAIVDEHPEHLDLAKRPTLKSIPSESAHA